MKQLIKLIPFALIALLAFAGCESPFSFPSGEGGTGSLKIVISDGTQGAARTLLPDGPSVPSTFNDFYRIDLTLTGPSSQTLPTKEIEQGDDKSVEFTALEPGEWTIRVEVFMDINNDVRKIMDFPKKVIIENRVGMQTVDIDLANAPINSNLDDGYFMWSYTAPNDVNVASQNLTIYEIPSGIAVNSFNLGSYLYSTYTQPLSPGYYTVVVKLRTNDGDLTTDNDQMAFKSEVIHIYPYLTTRWDPITFEAADFAHFIKLNGTINFKVNGDPPSYYKITVKYQPTGELFATDIGTVSVPNSGNGYWFMDILDFAAIGEVRLRFTLEAYNATHSLLGTFTDIDFLSETVYAYMTDVLGTNFTVDQESIAYIANMVTQPILDDDYLTASNKFANFQLSTPINTGDVLRVTYDFKSDKNLNQLAFALIGTGEDGNGWDQLTEYEGINSWGQISADPTYYDNYIELTATKDYEGGLLLLDISAGKKYDNQGNENPETATLKFSVLEVIKLNASVTFDKNRSDATEASPSILWGTAGTPFDVTAVNPQVSQEDWDAGVGVVSWNTKQDGTGNTFTSGTTVYDHITVYAQWGYTGSSFEGTPDELIIYAPEMTTNQGQGSTQGNWNGSENANGSATYTGGAVRYMFPTDNAIPSLDYSSYDYVNLEYVSTGSMGVILKKGTTSNDFMPQGGGNQYPTLSDTGSFNFVIFGLTGNEAGIAFQRNTGTGTVKWTKATFTKGTRGNVTFNKDNDEPNFSVPVLYGQPFGTLPTPTKEGYVFAGWFINGTNTPVTSTTIAGAEHVNSSVKAQWKAPVVAPPIVVNFNTANLAVLLPHSASTPPNGSSYTLTYGTNAGWGGAYAVFELTFTPTGNPSPNISDYKSVSFTYQGEGGDIDNKGLRLLATDSTGLTSSLTDDEAGQNGGGFMIAGDQHVAGKGSDTYTLELNGRKDVLATESTVKFAFYIHAASSGDGSQTSYTISNVTFNPMVEPPPPTPPTIVPGTAIDFTNPGLGFAAVGGGTFSVIDANSYTFNAGQPNLVKFTVDLGSATLVDYDLISFTLTSTTTYKTIDVIGAAIDGLTTVSGIPSSSNTVTTYTGGNNLTSAPTTGQVFTFNIANTSYTQGLTGQIELAIVADNSADYTISDFKLIILPPPMEIAPNGSITFVDYRVKGVGATVTVLSGGSGYEITHVGSYGNVVAPFTIKLDGKYLSDYDSVTFDYTRIDGDANFKQLFLVAGAALTSPTPKVSTADVSTGDCTIGVAKSLTIYIDDNATTQALTGVIELSIIGGMNPGAKYSISNVVFTER